MSNLKKIFATLIAVLLVVGMLPFGAMAETHVETHSFTIPTAQASGSDEPLITVGTISDSHVDYSLQNNQPYIRQSFIKAMNALKAENVDVLVVGGDMVSDNEDGGSNFRWDKSVYDRVISQYEQYATAASKTGKTLWVCGNHDYEVGMYTGSYAEGDYSSYYGFVESMIKKNGQPKSVYTYADDGSNTEAIKKDWLGAHYNINGFDFIIINARSWQTYSTGTLNWLDNTLAGIGAGKTVFVLGHYPLQDNRGVTNPSSYGISGDALTAFKAVMNKYDNAIYLYGHNHGTANGMKPWIASDVFERITHYDANGAVVNSRIIPPSSFITAFMGSAGYYDGSLTAADPNIIQAMTITVYTNRIEFKMINCGVNNGGVQEPLVWTVERNVLGGGTTGGGTVIDPSDIYTIPSDLTTTSGWSKNNFSLHYMDVTDGVLKNDWKQGTTYVNLQSGGHSRGTFDKRAGSAIRVFPEVGKSAVIAFTAPEDGKYKYEAPVVSVAKTNKGGNKQVVFSVMKDGVIYEITQPNNKDDFNGMLSGTINLKKGEKLLFVADHYVKYFNDSMVNTTDYVSGWLSGYYVDLTLVRIGDYAGTQSKAYAFDGSGLDYTENGYSIKSNTNFSIAAIDYSAKKLLSLQYGKTAVYQGEVGAAVYKGASGDVTIAYRDTDGDLMYGPFGAGNANKNIAAAIAFTAPEEGTYNLTALLKHDWDYNVSKAKNYAMMYEILDNKLNVIFSGNTANLYTAVDVRDTYSRAAGSVYLQKGETAYLVFRAAPEATEVATDTIAMKVLSLTATQVSAGCVHSWNANDTCIICGKTCTHTYKNGSCTVCGKLCLHKWKNSKCTVCGKSCSHSWNNSKCTICGKSCSHKWSNGKCTTCGKVCDSHTYKDGKCSICGMKEPKNPEGMLPPNLSGTTAPDNTTPPDNTTAPDTTPGATTPNDTTVPDTTVPDTTAPQQNNGGMDSSVLIAILIGVAYAVIIALIFVFFTPKKNKKDKK